MTVSSPRLPVAALNKHLVLAKMAVEETGRGLVEDKATKNIFACEHVTNYLAGQKTVGIIREDDVMGIDEDRRNRSVSSPA